MTKTAAGPGGTWTQNGTYTLGADMERALVEAGAAEFVGKPEPEPEVEVAAMPEPENAAKRTTRRKRGA